MENLTKEDIQKHIKSAYDSVDLINELQLKQNPTKQETERIQRNIEHLKIMMGKEWFVSGLKVAQKKQLNEIIK
jgi:hypothetical protein